MAQKPHARQLSNPYKVRANKTADQSISDVTWTQISFPTEAFDTNSNFASNVYTVPVTGYYRFGIVTTLTTNGQGVAYQVQVQKNGATYWLGLHQPYPATAIYTSANFCFNDLALLTAGDTIQFLAYVDTGNGSAATVEGDNGSTFCTFELAYLA